MLKPLQKSTSQKPCCRFAPRRFCYACFFSAASTIFRSAFQLVFFIFKPLQKKFCPQSVLSLCSKTVLLRLLFIFLTFRLPDMLSRLNPAMCERRNILVSSQVFLLRKRKLQLVLLDLQDGALQSQQEFLFR